MAGMRGRTVKESKQKLSIGTHILVKEALPQQSIMIMRGGCIMLESAKSHLNIENRTRELKGIFNLLPWLWAFLGTRWTS